MATGISTSATTSNQLPLISLCETVAKINMPTLVQANTTTPHQKVVAPVTLCATSHGENMYKLSLSNGDVLPICSNTMTKIVPTVATLTMSRDMKVDGATAGQKPIIVTVSGMQSIATTKQMPPTVAPLQVVTPHFGHDKYTSSSSPATFSTINRSAITTATAVLTSSGLQTRTKSPLAPMLPSGILTSKNIASLPMMVANASSFITTSGTATMTTLSPVSLTNSLVTVTPVIMTSTAPLVSIASNQALNVNQNGINQPQMLTPIIKVPMATTQKSLVPAFVKPVNIAPLPSQSQVTLAPATPLQPQQLPPSNPVIPKSPPLVNGVNPKLDAAEGQSDFDPIGALTWKDGIGTLPGSNIKFKLNEFRALEVITEIDAEMPSVSKESAGSISNEVQSGITSRNSLKESFSKMKEMYQTDYNVDDPEQTKNEDSKADVSNEIARCENCDCFGLRVEFCNAGRFCSQVCVAAFAHKKNLWLKRGAKDSKKKRKRKSSDAEEEDVLKKEVKLDDKESDPNNKDVKDVEIGKEEEELVPEVQPIEFCWNEYLKKEKAIAAPPKLFYDSQQLPESKNDFEVGMKMEGIDPKHPSLFCVLSVAEIRGFRIRLHFDGYSDRYEFWVNANSPDIFPIGWCEKNNHKLQPPKDYGQDEFNWDNYLKLSSNFVAAPRTLFSVIESKSTSSHGFKIGMKLEAVDKKNSSLVCVSTVADVMDNRFLIHFDGWEDIYDYWTEPNSPNIHPINWCQENGHDLTPPKEFKGELFCWSKYLSQTKFQAVPTRAFKSRSSNNFKSGMKIEVVDKRNPRFIRVATIADQTDHSLLIHFDGWSSVYDYWVDDDCPDIHPVTWCAKTNHPLEQPVDSGKVPTPGQSGCPTLGCPGLGHMKGPRHFSHHSAVGCPYSQNNIDRYDTLFQDRIVISKESYSDSMRQKTDQNSIASDGLRRCPTPGCNGSGHVKGKYSVHHGVSGCPIAAQQEVILAAISESVSTTSSTKDSASSSSASTNSNSQEKETKPLDSLRSRNGLGKGKKKKLHGTGLRGRPPKALGFRGRPSKAMVLLRAQQAEQQRQNEEAEASTSHSSAPSPVSAEEIHRSIFSPPISRVPDTQPPSWERLVQKLPGVCTTNGNAVKKWSVDDVSKFITELTNIDDISKAFVEQIIDGEAFVLLNQEDIVNIMKIKLGPALKIYNSILFFRSQLPSLSHDNLTTSEPEKTECN